MWISGVGADATRNAVLFNDNNMQLLIICPTFNFVSIIFKEKNELSKDSNNRNLMQRYSETLELSSLTEPNRIKHEFAGSELFQYFDSVRYSRKVLEFHCMNDIGFVQKN